MTSEPQSPEPQPADPTAANADLGTRFLARLIDSILLAVAFTVLAAPFGVGAYGLGFDFGFSVLWYGLLTAAISIGYFALMEANLGQTVGKMALKLRTEGPSGEKPTLEEAIKRNAFYALGVIPVLGGLAQLAAVIFIAVTISNSPTNTGWHDDFAGGTRVVKVQG